MLAERAAALVDQRVVAVGVAQREVEPGKDGVREPELAQPQRQGDQPGRRALVPRSDRPSRDRLPPARAATRHRLRSAAARTGRSEPVPAQQMPHPGRLQPPVAQTEAQTSQGAFGQGTRQEVDPARLQPMQRGERMAVAGVARAQDGRDHSEQRRPQTVGAGRKARGVGAGQSAVGGGRGQSRPRLRAQDQDRRLWLRQQCGARSGRRTSRTREVTGIGGRRSQAVRLHHRGDRRHVASEVKVEEGPHALEQRLAAAGRDLELMVLETSGRCPDPALVPKI